MLKELATVAAYGASASFGRDVYRSTKNGNPAIWLGIAVFLSIAGFKMIGAGGEREGEGAGVGALLLILGGVLVFNALAFLFLMYTGLAANLSGGDLGRLAGLLIALTAVYLMIASPIGLVWGRRERAEKERFWAIEDHNMRFLDENGFQDLGLGDEIIEDADGNRLKLREQSDDRLFFMVVGRRNMRAAITLDEEGRMTDYTGAVKL